MWLGRRQRQEDLNVDFSLEQWSDGANMPWWLRRTLPCHKESCYRCQHSLHLFWRCNHQRRPTQQENIEKTLMSFECYTWPSFLWSLGTHFIFLPFPTGVIVGAAFTKTTDNATCKAKQNTLRHFANCTTETLKNIFSLCLFHMNKNQSTVRSLLNVIAESRRQHQNHKELKPSSQCFDKGSIKHSGIMMVAGFDPD